MCLKCICSVPEVYLSVSKVRIQVFTIDGKNLDCWNHPNMLSLKNRMGGRNFFFFKSEFLCLKSTKSINESTFFKISGIEIQNFFS